MATTPYRVLIVDDEEPIRELLEEPLAEAGLDVVQARSATEALSLLENDPGVDLVLTDLRMPGMSGEGLVERLAREHPRVAVVIMTGHPSFESAKVAVRAQVCDYFVKPFRDLDKLRDRVLEILARRRRELERADLLRDLAGKNRELETQKNLLARKVSVTQRNLREQVRSLQKSREIFLTDLSRVMAIIDNLADGIVFTDTSGRVILVSPSAGEMLGILPFAAIGRPLAEVEGNRALLSLLATHRAMALHEDGVLTDVSFADGDGGEEHYSIHSSTVRDMRGSVCGNLTVVRDVSLRKKTEHLKNQFLSIVAHELRTPLTAIKAFATILDKGIYGELPGPQRSVVENIVSQSDRLGHEIDKIINMGRLEAEDFAPDLQKVKASQIIKKLISPFREEAGEKGLALEIRDDSGGEEVNADVHDIRRALRALTENALKFTPQGGRVEIRVSFEADHVVFEVRDTGIGIAPSDHAVIFEKFIQLENPLTRKHGGCGLGLSFASEILKAHGARIEVESELGKGATFRFCLPCVSEIVGEEHSAVGVGGTAPSPARRPMP